MLSAWNSQYHKRNNHLELRLKKIRVKLTNWWIFYAYSGNPNYNPYILTSRPKNLPLISLRTDEYSEFLSNKERVGQKWNEFWKKPEESPRDILNGNKNDRFKKQLPNKIPLKNIQKQNRHSQVPIGFKIYNDDNRNLKNQQNRNITKKKKPKTLKTMKNKKSFRKPLQMVDQNLLDECGSLGSFERDLLESANLTISRGALIMPCAGLKKSERELTTPPYIDDEITDEQQNIHLNQFIQPNIYEDEYQSSINENRVLDVIESSAIAAIDIENEFNNDSYYQNDNNRLQRAISNKPNYNALGFDGDRIAIQKKINGTGIRGWLANKVRPETRSTFENNHLTLNSYPVGMYQHQIIPTIQSPDFFVQQKFNIEKLRLPEINRYRENQVRNYVRPDKIKREKRKESRKVIVSRKNIEATEDNVFNVLKKIKKNTTDKLRDSLGQSQYIIGNDTTDNRHKKPSIRSTFHNWRIFNGHHYVRKTSNPHLSENGQSKQILATRQICGFEFNKRENKGKVVKIVSPAGDENDENILDEDVETASNNKENMLPYKDDDVFYDEYDIIADYEDYTN